MKPKGGRVQLESTKVKISNIRDRWLLNCRKSDYESYLRCIFLVIQSKKDAEFAERTKMTENVTRDFINLEFYME